MDAEPTTTPGRSASPRRRAAWISLALASLIVVGWVAWWATRRERSRRAAAPATPYANARPGVEFLGDAACARCHAEIAKTYREHPMGRSLVPTAEAARVLEAADRGGHRTFEADGLEYAVERRGDRLIHRESRKDASGRVAASNEAEARYAIGSGSQGVTFLVDRGGYLVESPITWYAQAGRWDLSPGYRGNNLHFERPAEFECLFCHANRVEPVAGTINRYREPIFRGHAIGCERCHGPGEWHAKRPRWDGEGDPNIVNPARLTPSLRDAVCEQCHLHGEARVVRSGRDLADYRPGLPLEDFLAVFVEPAATDGNRSVGHVEQLRESRCFQASGGKLGCISCHDPHELPAPDERVAYYRGRCLECHADRGCSLPRDDRLAQSPDDSCVQCHMPRRPVADIVHTASTLHRIPRHANPGAAPESGATVGDGPPLALFRPSASSARFPKEYRRDLGVALCMAGREEADAPRRAAMARAALPLLDEALKAGPDDPIAWDAKATAYNLLGRNRPSLEALGVELSRYPRRELALEAATELAIRLNRLDAGLDLGRRLVAVNPERSSHHVALARVLLLRGEWAQGAESCRRALRLNPADQLTRRVLVTCYLKLGEKAKALAELDILLAFDPPDGDELRRMAAQARP